jgi:hypothetical protein
MRPSTFMFCVVAVGVWLVSSAAPARAHHSAAVAFDSNKPIKLTGTVTKIEWANPHTIFYMDVRADDGNIANWGLELPSPNQLMRAGWMPNSMKIGDMVTVEGIHARDGSNHGMATAVILASTGKQLFSGKAEEP